MREHLTLKSLRYVHAQYRRAWTPESAESESSKAYRVDQWLSSYAAVAHTGLSESEISVYQRHLKECEALLDIGCGVGREAIAFAQRGLQVLGIDVCEEVIAYAEDAIRNLNLRGNASFQVGSICDFDFGLHRFDAIYVSSDVYAGIPGVANRIAALARCRRSVRPRGTVVFPASISGPLSWPSRLLVEGPRNLLRPLLGSTIPEFGDRWYPQDCVPVALFRHHFYSEIEVLAEIEAAGLQLVDRISSYFIARASPLAQDRARKANWRCPALLAQPVGPEAVLVQTEAGTAYRLNDTARQMWELACQGLSAAQIAERLCEAYDVPPAELEKDARQFIEAISEKGLLKPENGSLEMDPLRATDPHRSSAGADRAP